MNHQLLIDAGVHNHEAEEVLNSTHEGREKLRRWEEWINENKNQCADTQNRSSEHTPTRNTQRYYVDTGFLPALKFIGYFLLVVWILRKAFS